MEQFVSMMRHWCIERHHDVEITQEQVENTRKLCTLFKILDMNCDGIVEWADITAHILTSSSGIFQ